jgi:hypothetical protein
LWNNSKPRGCVVITDWECFSHSILSNECCLRYSWYSETHHIQDFIHCCQLCPYIKSDFLKFKDFGMWIKYFTLEVCVEWNLTNLSNLYTCKFYPELSRDMMQQCHSNWHWTVPDVIHWPDIVKSTPSPLCRNGCLKVNCTCSGTK